MARLEKIAPIPPSDQRWTLNRVLLHRLIGLWEILRDRVNAIHAAEELLIPYSEAHKLCGSLGTSLHDAVRCVSERVSQTSFNTVLDVVRLLERQNGSEIPWPVDNEDGGYWATNFDGRYTEALASTFLRHNLDLYNVEEVRVGLIRESVSAKKAANHEETSIIDAASSAALELAYATQDVLHCIHGIANLSATIIANLLLKSAPPAEPLIAPDAPIETHPAEPQSDAGEAANEDSSRANERLKLEKEFILSENENNRRPSASQIIASLPERLRVEPNTFYKVDAKRLDGLKNDGGYYLDANQHPQK